MSLTLKALLIYSSAPVEAVHLPDANVTGFFFFILGLAWTTLSINIRTVGGREASWAAGRQMVLESVSDARQLLRIPAHTGTDTQMHATRYLQKSAGLT